MATIRQEMKTLLKDVKNLDISGIVLQEKHYDKNDDVAGASCSTAAGDTGTVSIDNTMDVDDNASPVQYNVPTGTELSSEAAASFNGNNTLLSSEATTTTFDVKVIFMLGMAASGKTTFTQRLANKLLAEGKQPYIINLDPACINPPTPTNIDIRDTVDYDKVMQKYNLGPNGGIVTSLNLFTTVFDQVLDIVKRRSKFHEYILVDTPGQIECFLWSASGLIILHSFAAHFPTILTYMIDLTLCENPITFASNMMYGLTILYKSKLPMIITMNKVDLNPALGEKITEWMTDFTVLDEALTHHNEYSATLASSMVLTLEEFYKVISNCVVSAKDGHGLQAYQELLEKAVAEFKETYVQMYQAMEKEHQKNGAERKKKDIANFRKDFNKSTHHELFSMQATTTLTEGINILPHDDDEDSTGDSESEGKDDDDDDDTIDDFRTRESEKRDEKKKPDQHLPGTSSRSQLQI